MSRIKIMLLVLLMSLSPILALPQCVDRPKEMTINVLQYPEYESFTIIINTRDIEDFDQITGTISAYSSTCTVFNDKCSLNFDELQSGDYTLFLTHLQSGSEIGYNINIMPKVVITEQVGIGYSTGSIEIYLTITDSSGNLLDNEKIKLKVYRDGNTPITSQGYGDTTFGGNWILRDNINNQRAKVVYNIEVQTLPNYNVEFYHQSLKYNFTISVSSRGIIIEGPVTIPCIKLGTSYSTSIFLKDTSSTGDIPVGSYDLEYVKLADQFHYTQDRKSDPAVKSSLTRVGSTNEWQFKFTPDQPQTWILSVNGKGSSYTSKPAQFTFTVAETCGNTGTCGDGICGSGESYATCPQDCDEWLIYAIIGGVILVIGGVIFLATKKGKKRR